MAHDTPSGEDRLHDPICQGGQAAPNRPGDAPPASVCPPDFATDLHPLEGPEATTERRLDTRYPLPSQITVLFGHADVVPRCAGVLEDLSYRGLRLTAPPTARPGLHVGDAVQIHVREHAVPGQPTLQDVSLTGQVVRIHGDRDGLEVGVQIGAVGGEVKSRLTAYILYLAHRTQN